MKKIFTAFAAALLLAGCTSQYDDSALVTRIQNLETRVTALEGQVDALRSALGDGVFVSKVEEFKDPTSGKTTGITVTYTSGDVKYFTISPATDTPDPVISIIQDGTGALCWAVDGVIIQVGGQNVTVYQTPVFSIDSEGNLRVTIDGETVILGSVQNEGATLKDGIFTNLKVTDTAVVLTLADDTTVNIPFAEAFKLNIATTEFVYSTPAAIEIPYTVSAKTSGTVVDVYYPNCFSVKVEADKITVTPLTANASGQLLAYADSKVGLTSIVKITVEAEGVDVIDTPASATVDYLADSDGGSVKVNVVSNIEFDVKPQADWITVASVKSTAYVITLSVAENTTGAYREGRVSIVKKGTEDVIQTIVVGQAAPVAGPKDLGKAGTANCYIVTAAGDYKFAAVKGNSEEAVAAASVNILWETWNNDEEVTANSVISSVAIADGYVNFSVADDYHAGNAVIAAKDGEGTILWSWHIWVPATEITTVDGGLLATPLMDRNLGALVAAEASTEAAVDVRSFGLLYQWGRKDPSVGAKRVNSSSNATVAGEAISAPGLGTMTVEESIKNPTVWYSQENSTWLTEPDNTLWQDAVKTMYDPCPPGYRVPARDTSMPFFAADLTTNAGWAEDGTGCWFTMGDPASVFPFAGYRDDYGVGSVAHAYDRVFIWSAHNNGDTKGYGIDIRLGSRHQYSSVAMSRGAVVRCEMEATE